MNISILTNGTRGDLEPLITLGKELQKLGHVVTFAASSNFTDDLTEFNVIETPVNLQDYLSSDEGKKWMKDISKNPLNYIIQIRKLIPTMANDTLIAYSKASTNSDLIITTTGAIGDAVLKRELNIPLIEIQYQPLEPTSEFSYPFIKHQFKIGFINQLTFYLFESMISAIFRKSILKWQKEEFPGSQPLKKGIFKARRDEVTYKLGAYSSILVERPKDWKKHNIICGSINKVESQTPSDELLNFIEGGDPPLYIGFGSMVISDENRFRNLLEDILNQTDVRIIFCKGWSNIEIESIPNRLLVVDQAPHNWLFPLTLGVIHHGGAGTTHSVLRAGVPQVICPKTADQPFWAQRVYQSGLSTKPVEEHKLNIKRMIQIINFFRSEYNRKKAREISQLVNGENGLVNILEIITSLI